MEHQLWNLFWETGDPQVYLLCKKAAEQKPAQDKTKAKQKATSDPGTPSVSA